MKIVFDANKEDSYRYIVFLENYLGQIRFHGNNIL